MKIKLNYKIKNLKKMSALITDFTVGLINKSITKQEIIKHLKKIGKSNGYKYYSVVVPKKFIKYIKADFDTKCVQEYADFYKNSILVYQKQT